MKNPWAEPEPECIEEGQYEVEVSWISDHFGVGTFSGESEDDIRKYVEYEATPYDFDDNGGGGIDISSLLIEKIVCIKQPIFKGQEELIVVGPNQLALEL